MQWISIRKPIYPLDKIFIWINQYQYSVDNSEGNQSQRPFPSSHGPLYQNEVKCSAFDMEMIFHSHANKTHFHKKVCALGLILKVRIFGNEKWPILLSAG